MPKYENIKSEADVINKNFLDKAYDDLDEAAQALADIAKKVYTTAEECPNDALRVNVSGVTKVVCGAIDLGRKYLLPWNWGKEVESITPEEDTIKEKMEDVADSIASYAEKMKSKNDEVHDSLYSEYIMQKDALEQYQKEQSANTNSTQGGNV